MRCSSALAVFAALALGACSLPTADKESDAEARQLYQEIHSGADLTQDTNLTDEMKTPERLAELAAVKSLLPAGEPAKVENRSWNFQTMNDGSVATLVHAYVYSKQTVLAETVLRKGSGDKAWRIAGFHVSLSQPPGGVSAPVTPGEKT